MEAEKKYLELYEFAEEKQHDVISIIDDIEQEIKNRSDLHVELEVIFHRHEGLEVLVCVYHSNEDPLIFDLYKVFYFLNHNERITSENVHLMEKVGT